MSLFRASTVDAPSEAHATPPQHPQAVNTATVSTAIADVIRAECDHCFGLIGNANSYFTSALTESYFGYTAVRHEAAAIAAADAFHRAGGGLAVATTTCGAGFTNTITPLCEAKTARIPLVYVTGSQPTTPRPFDIDQAAILSSLGILFITATPSSARADAQIAVELARKLREPVVILIPFDVQNAPLIEDGARANNAHCPTATGANSAQLQRPLSSVETTGLDYSTTTIEEIAAVLNRAERPLIISGRGVVLSQTEELVRALGESVGAVFMHTAMACNVVDDPWAAGTVGGFAHKNHVSLAQQADVVIILGASWNAFQRRGDRMVSPNATAIHIIDEPHAAQGHADYRLYSDLAETLPILCNLVAPKELPVGSAKMPAGSGAPTLTWRERLGQLPAAEDRESQPDYFADIGADGRLDPRASLRILNQLLPQPRALCTDGGHFLGWVPKYLEVSNPHQQVIVGTAIQTIGLGLGSLLGVAAARPEEYCVLVTGDGGGLMGFADFQSAIDSLHRGAIVFMNDAAYGAELHQFAAHGLDTSSMVLDDIDFAALGHASGARGFSVATLADFEEVGEYFNSLPNDNSRQVAVIDIKISRHIVADFVAEVLARSSKV